ncbi:MAG: hypothetical protein ABL949_11600 [Fimbriimonadaceae bacterium]
MKIIDSALDRLGGPVTRGSIGAILLALMIADVCVSRSPKEWGLVAFYLAVLCPFFVPKGFLWAALCGWGLYLMLFFLDYPQISESGLALGVAGVFLFLAGLAGRRRDLRALDARQKVKLRSGRS